MELTTANRVDGLTGFFTGKVRLYPPQSQTQHCKLIRKFWSRKSSC